MTFISRGHTMVLSLLHLQCHKQNSPLVLTLYLVSERVEVAF